MSELKEQIKDKIEQFKDAMEQKKNNVKDLLITKIKEDPLFCSKTEFKLKIKIFRDYKDVINEAVKQDGMVLEFASKDLQGYRKIVLEAVKQNGRALEFASKDLKNNEEIVLEAVKQDGCGLEFASKDLKNNRKIVVEAVKKNGSALQYASDDLQKDKNLNILSLYQQGECTFKALLKNLNFLDDDVYNAVVDITNEKVKEQVYKWMKDEEIKTGNAIVSETVQEKIDSEIKKYSCPLDAKRKEAIEIETQKLKDFKIKL